MSSRNNNLIKSIRANNPTLGQKASKYMTINTLLTVIGLLGIVGIGVYLFIQYRNLKKSKKEEKEINKNACPDYWEIVEQLKNNRGELVAVTCKNTNKLGVCSVNPETNTFTFSDEIFNNKETADKARCQWAKQCKTAWTGYDNLCN
jgi:heme/copper-type cytochrome/quinol oxidase subunit 2